MIEEHTPIARPRKLLAEVASLRRRIGRAETVAYVSLTVSGGLLVGLILLIVWILLRPHL